MATDYTQLITNQHRSQPRFSATVELLTGAAAAIGNAAAGLTSAFNADVAVGVQLDAVGRWVGVSRAVTVPIANAYFAWDDPALGWDLASWKAPYEATEGITTLDDETYRAVIKAKIGSNYWTGNNERLNAIGLTAFAQLGIQCYVLDNLDMTTTVYILGTPSQALIEMIKRGIAPPKTAGVRITGYILASAPGAPFFALSVPTTSLTAGLDFGSFGDPV